MHQIKFRSTPYHETSTKLVERLRTLVPTHPEILTLTSPWDLFSIDGFDCKDLQPSLAQAAAALAQVQHEAAELRARLAAQADEIQRLTAL